MLDESSNLESLPPGAWRGYLTGILSRRLDIAKTWLGREIVDDLFFQREAVQRRILQRILELGYESFLRDAIGDRARFSRESGFILVPVRIDFDGRVGVDGVFFCRQIFAWLKLNVYVAISFLRAFVSTTSRGPATFVSDLGANVNAGGSDQRLVEFFRTGPIDPLRRATRFVIQTTRHVRQTAAGYCDYSSRPAVQILLENELGFRHLCALISFQVILSFRFFIRVVRCPVLVLLARDYALAPLWRGLSEMGAVEHVILTDANYAAQELFWADLPGRTYDVHCLWHSQNTRGLLIRGHGGGWEFPHRRFMAVDYNWYWTSSFQSWLDRNEIKGSGYAVGPIMFQADKGTVLFPDRKCVCIFDVTPTHTQWQKENGWPYIHYNFDVCKKLLDDVIAAVGRKAPELRVVLKHKRSFGPVHDPRYAKYVSLLEESGALEIVDSDVDIFALVRSCRVVVSAPFTTAALIGAHLNVPSFYYDPVGEVIAESPEQTDQVPLISDVTALEREIQKYRYSDN